jgi:ketosteroid isomerase-like protein
MSVNGVTNSSQAYESRNAARNKTGQNKSTDTAVNADNTAAVYEKSEQAANTKKVYRTDTATVERLKAEAEKRLDSLKSLVQKMLAKQGQTYTNASDMYTLLREGKVQVDPEVSAQAKKDIAEDGYWGVEQTSERMLSFAKALAGGDTAKADELIDAVKKGFEAATKAWGDKLPDICKKTIDRTIEKLEAWRDGKDINSTAGVPANTFTGQAAASTIAG